ncbi:MAG: molybdopterin-dependent oxidoreductase [Gemmatimonadales bacterium]
MHHDRLLHPMRRVSEKGVGRFERISWSEATDDITTRFRRIRRKWGGEAILPYHYGGSNGLVTDGLIDDLYFARLGASRITKTLCAATSGAVTEGMYGKMPGVAFQDYEHAKCIIIWGANPKVSNIHLVPFLKRAKRRGAFIAAVDPIRNFSAGEVDLHLSVRPGTDLVLALGLIKCWADNGRLDRDFVSTHARSVEPLLAAAQDWPLERAAEVVGVSESQIRRLAESYAAASPAVIRCGWGLERNRNGGRAIGAILAMPALLGKFGVRGGGYTLSNSSHTPFDRDDLFDVSEWQTRTFNQVELATVLQEATDPPVRALFVYNCNPAVTVPDQTAVIEALSNEDLFTVVFDQVMTDTAAYADILLPATTFLEHWDLRVSYGSYTVGGVRPVMPPRGEARSNPEVFAELGRAMGFEDSAFAWDGETAARRVAETISSNGAPLDFAELANGGSVARDSSGAGPIQFGDVFPLTADGRIDLCPSQLGPEPFRYESVYREQFPLSLVSPASSKMITSTLGEFNLQTLVVLLNPGDAASRGVETGDDVRVFNELGEVVCIARITDRVRKGVASMPKGAWRKMSRNGYTSTALCPAHVNDVGGGACFNDARVEVERQQ